MEDRNVQVSGKTGCNYAQNKRKKQRKQLSARQEMKCQWQCWIGQEGPKCAEVSSFSMKWVSRQLKWRCELNEDDTNGHAKVDKEKAMRPQPYIKTCRQLRSDESSGPWGRTRQLVIQHQWSAPKACIRETWYGLGRLYVHMCIQ